MSRSTEDEYLSDAEYEAWHGCLTFTNAAMRDIDRELTDRHGISIKEFDVLITLFNARGGRLRMSELAERVVLTPSGVTHLVSRLEREALVERLVADDDRRSFFAVLTGAGRRRLREARPTHNDVIRARLTDRLTGPQLRALGRIWTHVLRD
jgi:DNA-binding MarR family transcriptional regulator